MSKQKAKVVIGLQYGDEGKGLTVNEICKTAKNPVVVRFSAGQQCGHTVYHGDIKHTFSNFGSGSLQGIPTYFTEHTCFYPVTIVREREVLVSKGIIPKLVIHPMAKMVTPWDVLANEQCAVNMEHGTCGLGIGKTEKRNKEFVTLRAVDLMHRPVLEAKIAGVVNYYESVIKSLEEGSEAEKIYFEEVKEFWTALDLMIDYISLSPYYFLEDFKTLVFEGSQGILLDKDHGVFPNVTYSSTTSKNAMEVCDLLGIKKRRIFCVTRAYSTRHGNGMYVEEDIVLKENENETNKDNKYQGKFKVASLDHELIGYAHNIEMIYSGEYPYTLVVTCANQVEEDFDPMLLVTDWDDFRISHSRFGDFKRDY